MLMKHKKEVAYDSLNMKTNERNYPSHDLKLVEVVVVLKILRNYSRMDVHS